MIKLHSRISETDSLCGAKEDEGNYYVVFAPSPFLYFEDEETCLRCEALEVLKALKETDL